MWGLVPNARNALARRGLVDVRFALKATTPGWAGSVACALTPVIHAFQTGDRIIRHGLADCKWDAIKPMPPNKPRGIPRVNNRHVLNGAF
jgi:hypothetical protein